MIPSGGLPVRRVYLFHLVAFVAAAVLLGLAAPERPKAGGPMHLESAARYVRARLRSHSDLGSVEAELSALAEGLGVAVTVFDARDRPVLDTNEGRTETPDERTRLESTRREVVVLPKGKVAFRLADTPGSLAVVTLRWPRPRTPRSPVVAGLVLLIAILAASYFFSRSLVRPIRRLGAAAAAFGAGDLTARADVKDGDELGELASAFNFMAARIERLVRGQKEMLANISHELRTPLARIQVAIELAAEGDPDLAQAALSDIEEDVEELGGLLEDVLANARLDLETGQAGQGAPPHRFEAVDPRRMLERAEARLRRAAPERALAVEVAPDLCDTIVADETLLRRAVDNLLDNARKYTEGRITLRAICEQDVLQIEVGDEGPGLSEDQQAKLFTPFFRAAPKRASGVGLGLSLVRRIAELHGGSVEVKSAPSTGSTFTLRVRRAPITGG